MRNFFIFPILVALTMNVGTAGPSWKQEPGSIFGIPIGGVLNPGDVRDCGGVMNEAESKSIAACAMKRPMFGDGVMVISGFPVDSFSEGAITIDGGKVQSVLLKSSFSSYQDVKNLMIERYGRPSSRVVAKFEMAGGKSLPSEVLTWSGKTVTITLAERSGTVGSSSTLFSTTASIEGVAGAADSKRRSDASRMQ